MNDELAIRLQCWRGLELEESDEALLMQDQLDPGLLSLKARLHFAENPDWREQSLKLFEAAKKRSVNLTYPGREDYPALWYHLSMRPPIASYIGQPVWKSVPLLPVVGSRTPSADTCRWMNTELREFLRRSGWGTVSGGARGVDQWAHRLSLETGAPTVCVFPSGVLNPYPLDQEAFWLRVLDAGGCLLSTFGLTEALRKTAFHIRNRWIAGFARYCFVVEANRRSGSSLTARLALEEGRDIWTLPTSPLAAQGLANLDLLFNGAQLVRNAEDLIDIVMMNGSWVKPSCAEAFSKPPAKTAH